MSPCCGCGTHPARRERKSRRARVRCLLLVANSVETRHIAPACRNPEIASRLSMSRGTVKTHLAHVYAKLQVANRTELALLAGGKS